MLFSGCGLLRPRYVPVETRVDSVYVERLVERVDTLSAVANSIWLIIIGEISQASPES